MSDEMFDQEDEAGGEEQPTTAGKKKIGFLPAIVIDILKWGAIVIGAIIFIVGYRGITVRFMGTRDRRRHRAAAAWRVRGTAAPTSELVQPDGGDSGQNR